MPFDSNEYYIQNKKRICEYNKKYFKTYYEQNKDKLRLKQPKQLKKYLAPIEIEGCIIECNVKVVL